MLAQNCEGLTCLAPPRSRNRWSPIDLNHLNEYVGVVPFFKTVQKSGDTMNRMLVAIMATVFFSVSAYAAVGGASSAKDVKDRWALTEADWSKMTGPRAREVLGLPSRFGEVLSAAQNGEPMAMAVVAGAYAVGSGTEVDVAAASRWAEAAAKSNLGFPLYVLAKMEQFGTGRPINMERYRTLLVAAMKVGHREAAFELGAYHLGRNENSQAATVLRAAAEKGHVPAQYSLALLLTHPVAPDADFKKFVSREDESLFWFKSAAREGYEKASLYAEAMTSQVNLKKLFIDPEKLTADDGSKATINVNAIDNSLLGYPIHAIRSYTPCATKIYAVPRSGNSGDLWVVVDWTESDFTGFMNVEGNVGLLGSGGNIYEYHTRINFNVDKGPNKSDVEFVFRLHADSLSKVCKRIRN